MKPRYYFTPKPDISAYELAQIMQMLNNPHWVEPVDGINPVLLRHMTAIEAPSKPSMPLGMRVSIERFKSLPMIKKIAQTKWRFVDYKFDDRHWRRFGFGRYITCNIVFCIWWGNYEIRRQRINPDGSLRIDQF